MYEIILSVSIAFLITYFTIPVVIFLSRHFNIYDMPDERKVHTRPISSLGGLGIFAGLVITTLLIVVFKDAAEFQYYIAAFTLVFFIGLKDDLLAVSPLKKFTGQLLASLLVVYKGGIRIQDMNGLAGIHQLPEPVSVVLSCFTIIVVVNSINLIDGVDGLAGSLVLLATLVLGSYFLMAGVIPYALLSFILAGCLIGFLLFNFQPAKIFMGDTGSLVIGMVCAVLLLKFISVSGSGGNLPMVSGPAIGFSILMVPLADTLRVFSLRIMQGRSPFSPDRNHIHHILLRKGFSHRKVTLALVVLNLLFIVFGFAYRNIGNNWLFVGFITFFFAAVYLIGKVQNQRLVLRQPSRNSVVSLKVVPGKVNARTTESAVEMESLEIS